ncbi:replication factor-a protein [Aureobasidium subglaciale]|nr:replication factor-a protein [Aureobasidium subglaciale]
MANPMDAITTGCLRRVFAGEQIQDPVVQCVQIKPMNNSATGVERFRVVFNDTVNFIQSMLAQQTNHIVHDGKLKKGSLVKLKQFQANSVKDKPILVIIDLEVLDEYGECDKLGQPGPLEVVKSESDSAAAPTPQAQPAAISGNQFYGNKPQQQQPEQQQQSAPQKQLPTRSSGQNGPRGSNIHPIEALSPYQPKWTIKARCSQKGGIKEWHNKNGEGKLFSCNFLDESGEIRATGFKEAVDQWYEFIQEGSVYYVSNCKVQLAKKQFSNVNHDYELTFERDTIIEKAEDNEGVPQITYNFTTLADLQSVEKDTTIDTIGVLKETGEVSEIVSKTTSKPFSKRELTLVDNTGYNVRLTIWGNTAMSFDVAPETVIAFKGVKVSDFGGRSLSLLSSGTMAVNPDIDDAHKLKGWYDAQGRNDTFSSHTGMASTSTSGRNDQMKTIAQVRDENLGMGESTDYFSLKATIVFVKSDSTFAYPACLSEGCNKKVVEVAEGEWRCERCDKGWPKPEWRYIMSINVSDHTGQMWLSLFDDVGRMIMGRPANDIMQMRDEMSSGEKEVFANAVCQTYVFRCRAKMDTFQDQQRVRYQVSSAGPVNWSAEGKKLADLIKQYSISDNSDSLFVN